MLELIIYFFTQEAASAHGDSWHKQYKKPRTAPPQQFFNPDTLSQHLASMIQNRASLQSKRAIDKLGLTERDAEDANIFMDEVYTGGLLVKEMNVATMLSYTDVRPTLDEMKRLRPEDDGAEDGSSGLGALKLKDLEEDPERRGGAGSLHFRSCG